MTVTRRKLIEVSLPLETINRESAKEKSVPRKGHPATMHLWWARRPLAAARAVLFAQLVDDPSSHPEQFPTLKEQKIERERLHNIIERMVAWENTGNKQLFEEAYFEILKSTDGSPPPVLDPFAGGGTIPLEAQRLGLRAHASDLNPVSVLVNKALIEFPPKFRNHPPVFPNLAASQIRSWNGTEGLSADIRAYGERMREKADAKIGNNYPLATLSDGSTATVISWIWARTVICPNPQCRIEMPLVRTWWLGKKKGREAYIVPEIVSDSTSISRKRIEFKIGRNLATAPTADNDGTVGRAGAVCISCGSGVDLKYVRLEGQANRIGSRLMATVAEGNRQRVYCDPTSVHIKAADIPSPKGLPEGELFDWPGRINVVRYGMLKFSSLFTNRQALTLITLGDLIEDARIEVLENALKSGLTEGESLENGGTGALAYADAVATYLSFGLSKLADWSSSICSWIPQIEGVRDTFARQAIPMVWDFVEINPFSSSVGNFRAHINWVADAVDLLPATTPGVAEQKSATDLHAEGFVISTDPPYYDNIGYSDLSDFFYVWLRRSTGSVHPNLLSTILVPKNDELVANPYRHGGKAGAKEFFEEGFYSVFSRARKNAITGFPMTVYYAFKQSTSSEDGDSSSGWETLLEGMVGAGWSITATWPMRSERSGRMLSVGTNALASSIVLSLRPRPENSPTTDRRGFISALQRELPAALRDLQQGAIAPVDLPQAAIGPGMSVFSRYAAVIESDGSKMRVRSALARINEVLDEVLSEQEGDFDATTRFAIAWYRQYGYATGNFGDADNMARARNASMDALDRAGVLSSRAGKVKLLTPVELPEGYDPIVDSDISAWEVLHHLIRVLDAAGLSAAGTFLNQVSRRVDSAIELDLVKELAFLLFSIADSNKWTKDAIAFNNVATSWSETIAISRQDQISTGEDPSFDYEYED